jgi:RNA polymerase sigma factor (sigma-70 family)
LARNTAAAIRTNDTETNAPKPAEVQPQNKVVSIDFGAHRERVRATRDELVEQYTPLAISIAEGINRRTPPSIELEDLIQTGLLALMHAATTFRPDAFPGITFGAYARHRVAGAILDSISGRHWRDATLAEIPDPIVAPDSEPAIEPTVEEDIDAAREMARVQDAMQYLEPRDRQILASYYRDNGNFSTAGEDVGLSRRRAGEVHAEVIGKLRRILHA